MSSGRYFLIVGHFCCFSFCFLLPWEMLLFVVSLVIESFLLLLSWCTPLTSSLLLMVKLLLFLNPSSTQVKCPLKSSQNPCNDFAVKSGVPDFVYPFDVVGIIFSSPYLSSLRELPGSKEPVSRRKLKSSRQIQQTVVSVLASILKCQEIIEINTKAFFQTTQFKANPHRASAATLALAPALALPLEYMVKLGNGRGIDF